MLRLLSRRLPQCRALTTSAGRGSSASMSPELSPSAAMRWAVGGWSFFITENVVLSENRTSIIDSLGEQRYHLLYGALSTAACVSIAVGFRRIAGAAPLQWAAGQPPPPSRLALGGALQAIGFAGLAQSLPKLQIPFTSRGRVGAAPEPSSSTSGAWSVRCPFDFSKHEGLYGVQRISRHASLWSFAAVCLGFAVITPSLPQAVCLAMPTAMALIGGAHHDSRQRRGMGGHLPAELDAATSHIPGVALLSGAQGDVGSALRILSDEVKWINAGLGVAVAFLFVLRHSR